MSSFTLIVLTSNNHKHFFRSNVIFGLGFGSESIFEFGLMFSVSDLCWSASLQFCLVQSADICFYKTLTHRTIKLSSVLEHIEKCAIFYKNYFVDRRIQTTLWQPDRIPSGRPPDRRRCQIWSKRYANSVCLGLFERGSFACWIWSSLDWRRCWKNIALLF